MALRPTLSSGLPFSSSFTVKEREVLTLPESNIRANALLVSRFVAKRGVTMRLKRGYEITPLRVSELLMLWMSLQAIALVVRPNFANA